jgi:3-oxoacyl-[acyl-carrier-protein] synthase-3
MGAKIVAIDYYLPEKTVESKDLKAEFTDFDIIKTEHKLGIKSRHIHGLETTLEMGFKAAKKVLDKFTESIDFIVFCTQTPDFILPTGACILQDKLELPKTTGAFDFNLGCSGYVYGLAICKGLIEAKIARNILFVTSDTYTKYIHPKDKGNRTLFGDGATASIISFSDSIKIGDFVLGTDGGGYDKLIIRNGGGANNYVQDAKIKQYGDGNLYTDNNIYMNGPEIFNFTIANIPILIEQTLEKNVIKKSEVDYFVFHQANKFMLEYLRKKCGIEESRFHLNLEETGNTVSSTIPIALVQAIEEGKIKENSKVMLAGFGVGLSWGATIIEL